MFLDRPPPLSPSSLSLVVGPPAATNRLALLPASARKPIYRFQTQGQRENLCGAMARELSAQARRQQLATTAANEAAASRAPPSTPRVAIIGAGFAGLAAARACARHGLSVDVFEVHPESFWRSSRDDSKGDLLPASRR